MKSVELPFKIKYTNTNFSPSEKNPFIRCYLDARFNRRAVDVDLKHEHYVKVSGKLKEGHKIDRETALCFVSIAWRKNHDNVSCMVDTGVCHVEFGTIRDQIQKSGKCVIQMPLQMYTADRLEKADIQIEIEKLNVDIEPENIKYSISSVSSNINSYINSNVEEEQSMEETFGAQTANMRIPYNYSESGIQSGNGIPLPAVSYVMSETPEANDAYWINAFSVVMDRDGLKPEDWNRLNDKGKARAAVHTACYIAQYLDYIGDTVDKNGTITPYENFGDGLSFVSGDCEDLGTANLQSTNGLVYHDFSEIKGEPMYHIMMEIKSILKQYVPPLSLDVVRGAQVSDNVNHYGAHMNDNYIPKHMFKEWMENTREGRLLSRDLPWGNEKVNTNLPFLVGEGTGMYECYGVSNPNADIMGYVYQAQSISMAKTPITHPAGVPGNFFVGSLVGLTDYFQKRGSKPLAFWYCDKSKGMSRGASYSDMMNRPENVAIKVQKFPSKMIMDEMEEKTLRRIPPMPLILTPIGQNSSRHHNSVLDRICKSISGLNRTPGSAHRKVPVYFRPHHLSYEIGQNIIHDFQRLDRIWKVDYKLEEINDSIWGYRMVVYVN